MKYRFWARNQQHGNAILTGFLGGSIPTGTYKNGSTSAIVTPTLAGGKGWGKFDFQSTLAGTLPVNSVNVLGRTIASNTTFQYHAQRFLWPEAEINSSFWKGGTNDSKKQTFVTPGLIFGRFPIHHRVAFSKTNALLSSRAEVGFTVPCSIHVFSRPADETCVGSVQQPRRQGMLRSMQNSAPFHPHPSASGLTLVELESSPTAFHAVGVSAAWHKLLMQANMAAPHMQIAAIEGESGSGKQTLARYLFTRSPLSGSSFQRRDAREWLATDADPTTLFGFTYLDRVDLLAPPGQGLLLGVLKTLQDRPPGRAVVLASSQIPLRQMAGQGLLLPDLAFRLTAIRFAIPPLRQRREDIAPLAQFLLNRICARYQQRAVSLGPGSVARLLLHNWPVNVRELASVLETALLEADNGIIRPIDLALPDGLVPGFESPFGPRLGASAQANPWANPGTMLDPQSAVRSANLALDAVIRQHVQYVIDLNRGNKLRAARQLSISRSTLYRILANEDPVAR